jgi:hypothetical protein
MRSIQSRISNLGNQIASANAKLIVRHDSDRPSAAMYGALFGLATRPWSGAGAALRHWATTATRTLKKRVTGGACSAVALQRSGRHQAMCRLAAR